LNLHKPGPSGPCSTRRCPAGGTRTPPRPSSSTVGISSMRWPLVGARGRPSSLTRDQLFQALRGRTSRPLGSPGSSTSTPSM
jgi:hypothetical protein